MPACGSTTTAPSRRTSTRSTSTGTKRETSSVALARCTRGTWCRPAWASRPSSRADGRTILRASYGRFHQGILTAEVAPTHPGMTPITTMAFDPATGGYTRLVSVVDPTTNVQVDPHMRAPLTDEYSIGVDRELGRRLAVALAYIRKTGSDYIAWTDVGGHVSRRTRERCPTARPCRSSCSSTPRPIGASC